MMAKHQGRPAKEEMCEFQVIGERKDDLGHLLLMDGDGHFYDYDLAHDAIVPIEPGDSWAVDVIEHAGRRFQAPVDKIAS